MNSPDPEPFGQRSTTARTHCLQLACQIEHALPDPRPFDSGCHHNTEAECDCPPVSFDLMRGRIALIEDAVVDRILRNASHFERWIRTGVTPEQWRGIDLDAKVAQLRMDGGTGESDG